MIKPVGQNISAAIDATKLRETTQARAPVAPTAPVSNSTTERVAANPAARLAQQGAPIDMDKVARIKAAIASGNYPVDADAIADRMVELDLPRKLN